MDVVWKSVFWAAATAVLGSSSLAQSSTRASSTSAGAQGFDDSREASVSADGRHVAFSSEAINLVAGDTNAASDVFVKDLQTGATTRASVLTGGGQANGGSFSPAISADARYVTFVSAATNLVAGDTNAREDVFVHDRQTGTTSRASLDSSGAQANDFSSNPALSSDGRYVAFGSFATNLVAGDTNADSDVFVRDRQTGITTRVSLDSAGAQGNSNSLDPSISADGRYVAFTSYATNLVAGDTNSRGDVFVHDRQTAATVRASVSTAGAQGDQSSVAPPRSALQPNGHRVVFWSPATNLVAGDTNARADVFVRELVSGTTTRESLSSTGAQGDDQSLAGSISSDGRYVSFSSSATNLVPNDTNAVEDVFVKDRQTGATARLSLSTGGVQGNLGSALSAIAANGNTVVFESQATNLVPGDTNAVADVFARTQGTAWQFTPFCFGDGTGGSCPCQNSGQPGRGCQNSAGTGGSLLEPTGTPSLSGDTLHFTASGELPTSLSILLQGTTGLAGSLNYGDGLRCVGGSLKRLFASSASGGSVTVPAATAPAVSARSATLGDPISPGSIRSYQVYYRDANPGFCPAPTGSTFNISRAIAVVWGS